MLKVKTANLLVIAGVVWAIAGVNVAAIGLGELVFLRGVALAGGIIGGLAIFAGFAIMFHKMMAKHVRRIRSYTDEKTNVFRFFDARGYFIMIFMIALGFALRGFSLVPSWFVAFFYTGLGTALVLTGLLFLVARFVSKEQITAWHRHGRASAR